MTSLSVEPAIPFPTSQRFPHPKPRDIRPPCWMSPRSLFPTSRRFPTQNHMTSPFPCTSSSSWRHFRLSPYRSAVSHPNHVTSVRHVGWARDPFSLRTAVSPPQTTWRPSAMLDDPAIPFSLPVSSFPPKNHVTSVRHVWMTSLPDDVPSGEVMWPLSTNQKPPTHPLIRSHQFLHMSAHYYLYRHSGKMSARALTRSRHFRGWERLDSM